MRQCGSVLPKALVEVEGKVLLEHAIEALQSLEISRIVIVVGHLESAIREYFSSRDSGVDVRFVRQERALGLANAIAVASTEITSDFVVLCPDNLYSDLTDLLRARDHFRTHRPTFLLLGTVTPTHQRNRGSYPIAARRNIGSNLYEYRASNGKQAGIGIHSTGCVFFQREALHFLPSVSQPEKEHKFRDYLELISDQAESLIYILRGRRDDFSAPDDIQTYLELKARLRETVGQGVSAILMNEVGQILLQQRDNNPNIRYPGHWSLFGGTIENGESPYEGLIREVQEEIGFEIRNFGLFREFVHNNKHEFAFVGEITAELSQLSLNEGDGMAFVDPSSIAELLIRPDDKETLNEYFGVENN